MKEWKNRWKIKERNGAIKDGEIENMKNSIDERKWWLKGRNQCKKKMRKENRDERKKENVYKKRFWNKENREGR